MAAVTVSAVIVAAIAVIGYFNPPGATQGDDTVMSSSQPSPPAQQSGRYELMIRDTTTQEIHLLNRSSRLLNVQPTPTPTPLPPTNVAPEFDEGETAIRYVMENAPANQNIGQPVTASDGNGDRITYTMSGTDAASFNFDRNTAQLKTKSGVSYDYDAKASYELSIEARDSSGTTDNITVSVEVTDNVPPQFGDSIYHIPLDVPNNGRLGRKAIGAPITATDTGDVLTYQIIDNDQYGSPLNSQRPDGSPATPATQAFDINSTTGQLYTKSNVKYDPYEQDLYQMSIIASDREGEKDYATIDVVLQDNNRPPAFRGQAPSTVNVYENGAAGATVANFGATDPDGGTITYHLMSDHYGNRHGLEPFTIDANGVIKLSATQLSYEDHRPDAQGKKSIAMIVEARDNRYGSGIAMFENTFVQKNLTVYILDREEDIKFAQDGYAWTVNWPVSNNQVMGTVSATDPDYADDEYRHPQDTGDLYSNYNITGGTPVYSLSGTDAAKFEVSSSGRVSTKAAVTHGTTYTMKVKAAASNDNTETDEADISITVQLNNSAPTFGAATVNRSIAENAGNGANVGAPVTARDANGDTLTYTLSGTDAASFSINAGSGQITANSSLDYETKSSYSVIVTAADPYTSTAVTVNISVTDVNEPPVFNGGTTQAQTGSIAGTKTRLNFVEATAVSPQHVKTLVKGLAVGAPIAATGKGSVTYSMTPLNPGTTKTWQRLVAVLNPNAAADCAAEGKPDEPNCNGDAPLGAPDSRAFRIDPTTGQIYAPTVGVISIGRSGFGDNAEIFDHYSWPWTAGSTFQVRVKACDATGLCANSTVNITISN